MCELVTIHFLLSENLNPSVLYIAHKLSYSQLSSNPDIQAKIGPPMIYIQIQQNNLDLANDWHQHCLLLPANQRDFARVCAPFI
jgi:hypothetical protein